MTKTENRKNIAGIKLKPIGIGVVLGIAVITLVLFLGAMLISNEIVPETFGTVVICGAALLGAFCGGFLSGRKNKGSFVLTGVIVGAILFFLRMIASAFAADSQIFDSSALTILISLIIGGFFGGLMAGKKRHKRKK